MSISKSVARTIRDKNLLVSAMKEQEVQIIVSEMTQCDTLAAVNSALRGALDYVKNHSTQQDVVFIAEEALSACPPDSMAQQLADSRKECGELVEAVQDMLDLVMISVNSPSEKRSFDRVYELIGEHKAKALVSKYQGKEGEK
jgi:hypothetical protein